MATNDRKNFPQGAIIQLFVEYKLLGGSRIEASQLSLALVTLLKASTTHAVKHRSVRKRPNYQLPTQGLSKSSQESLAALLLEKTRLKSRLLYNLNKSDLREFVSDPANNFLVTYFTQN